MSAETDRQPSRQTKDAPEPKKKGGRPLGFSPKHETKGATLEDDGDYVIIRVQKKQLMKLLLKDLI